jgi:predicted RNA-binding protein with RPS1 domain
MKVKAKVKRGVLLAARRLRMNLVMSRVLKRRRRRRRRRKTTTKTNLSFRKAMDRMNHKILKGKMSNLWNQLPFPCLHLVRLLQPLNKRSQ